MKKQANVVREGTPDKLIINLITDAFAQGQSVLFITDKQNVQDRVKAGLEQVDLGEFCLELPSQIEKLHAELKKRLEKEYSDITQLENKRKDLQEQEKQLLTTSQIFNTIVGPNNEKIYDIFWAVEKLRGKLAGESLYVIKPITSQDFNKMFKKLTKFCEQYQGLSKEVLQDWQGFIANNIWPGDEEVIQPILSNMLVETQVHQAYIDVLIEETQMPLTQDLATLRSLAKIDTAPLMPIPKNFDTLLAIKLLEKGAIEKLRQVKTVQGQYQLLLNQTTRVLGHGKYPLKFIQEILQTTSQFENLGFGKESMNDIRFYIENGNSNISPLSNDTETIEDYLNFLKLRQLAKTAPKDLILHKYPEHALEVTSVLFQHASETFSDLMTQWVKQKEYFLLNKIPNSEILYILIDTVRQNNWFAFLSVNYWRVQKFLVNSNIQDLVEKLETLAILKRKTEQEIQRKQYKTLFGPLFQGFETDWMHLKVLIEWSQNIAKVLGTPEKAQNLLATQADPSSYLLKITTLKYDKWLKITKIAEQFKLPFKSDFIVKTFIEKLNERGGLLVKLVFKLQQQLPHLSDKPLISIHRSLQDLLRAMHLRTEMEQKPFIKELFGKKERGIETNITASLLIADWLNHLKDIMPIQLLFWLIGDNTDQRVKITQRFLHKNKAYLANFVEHIKKISEFGDTQDWMTEQQSLKDLAKSVNTCQNTVNILGNLAKLYHLKQELDEFGLENITKSVTSRKIHATNAPLHFQYAFYHRLARDLIRKHNVLAKFSRIEYDNLQQHCAILDKLNFQQLAYQMAQRRVPLGNSSGTVGTFTEKKLILHELNKKSRHIPIRQLICRASKALQALKPCFMMTALSFSQYLVPEKIKFDLLIMDEASQVPSEDAFACCKQIVIVADPMPFIYNSENHTDFEIAISKILLKQGYKTVPQIGGALIVCHPDKPEEYILGIEYDGKCYHSNREKHLGLKIHRIWSVDFFKNRDAEIQRLLHVIGNQIEKHVPLPTSVLTSILPS